MDPQPQLHQAGAVDPARVRAITGPSSALLAVYLIRAGIASVFTAFMALPFVLVPLLLKYYTLKYRFEEDALVINWGFFFRRESIIPYARIQDIHLTRSFLERWFSIGTVEVQTASATRGAQESLLGLKDDEMVRDFLYQRMRGNEPVAHALPAPAAAAAPAGDDPRVLLGSIRDELRAARSAVEAR
ncbi:MAG: PH domain-containing protein [Planctomycetota bacterium]